MSFFTQLAALIGNNEAVITLKKKGDLATVSVVIKPEVPGSETTHPLIITGTTEELDNGFFHSVSAPIKKVSGLMSEVTFFEKQAEIVKKKSEEKALGKKDEAKKDSKPALTAKKKEPEPIPQSSLFDQEPEQEVDDPDDLEEN